MKDICNLAWRKGTDIIINEREVYQDLDNLHFPAWDLLNPNTYPPAPQGFTAKKFPIAPIIATRGCPFDCNFCCAKLIMGRKPRYRSPSNIVGEIKYLHEEFGVNEINFMDDNFTMRKDYVLDVCRKIKELPFELHWTLPQGIRLHSLDEELLKEMKTAGCYRFAVGIESGSQRILNDMNKKQTINQIYDKIKLIRNVGIDSMGFFIIGYPTESLEDVEKTISFSKKLRLTYASFSLFKPYPDTPVYNELKKQGKITTLDWKTFNYDKVTWSPDRIDSRQLKKMQRKATLSFYLRPKVLLRFLLSMRNAAQIKFLIKRIYCVILQRA